MKNAVSLIFILCLFALGCANQKEELLLKGIGAMAKEDAYKTTVLIGNGEQQGILQFAIRQNPGNEDLHQLKTKVAESAARCLQIAEQLVALIQESPKLTQEQKALLLTALQEAMKIWKWGGGLDVE